ncbi:MAG TPA: CDGSH iron-sulfur domain-containing protein [Thermoleophilaceae bacterium]|jgi:CDGSH-type Zn-finger protein/uncharacterized Fe-S cluster protein YjdI|nr:CDGSH iron-sulfur domain-containing protein [Thermoleophilaceae bacterium]
MPHRRTYETDSIRVHWDSSRCIHTGICLRRLPAVFDVNARPWVDLSAADADAVADTVAHCPSGALRYERLDGAQQEQAERPTVVLPIENGPLLMVGDLDVKTPEGEPIVHETRLTLCRCGMSRNQPFCDNSHRRRNWESGPTNEPEDDWPPPREDAAEQPTKIVPMQDASLDLRGHLRIYHSDGKPIAELGRVLLCRCGQSGNKPFCDSSHHDAGFCSRGPDVARDRLEAETPAAFTPNPGVPSPPDVAN